MQWLEFAGAVVCKPLFAGPDYDLVADWGDRIERVQVKTSTCWRNDRYEVTLVTRGGNQSWTGVTKLLDRSRIDALFVHVGDGRRWYIPASTPEGTCKVVLGGPKYAAYEVEPGEPLPARTMRQEPPLPGKATLD
jgi:hypothetical protein